MSDDGVHVTSRIRDPELVDALEAASEEMGSRSEAIRAAVRETYVGDSDETNEGTDEIPVKARDAHRELVEWAGIGGRLELDTAESVLANQLNIQKEAVRKTVIYPLKREDALRVHQGIHTVTLVIGRLDGDEVEPREPPATASGDAVADGGTRERLDELAAAGVEVADGDE
ncbi:ribbon-helix-helix domain-containing protein [Halorubrum cibi]|uniref:Ribbon-helix-helix protein, copG family n=1 Tax=Halorubrum cibi TaxID=413815 RepID=A0A521EC68_9EURY|nr:ribbon-helix-helix domain-containing protein [Halorubrum cibi]SMO81526.1 hypothetical protein SAMN06264867_11025 [Halorubrum cibi]